MADANRNTPGSADRQDRQQRHRAARQMGASGHEDEGATPDEARNLTEHRVPKTRKHSSGEL
ncbi:MAG TPA: hypothetical protein VFS40_14705 [Gemmatimonadales bacterium]|nr:hypothetical protein [Gemmatimonadales bacterium]